MAAAAGMLASELPTGILSESQQGLGTPTRAHLLRSFNTYAELFKALDNHPEGDVRHRFLRARAFRAPYVERLVRGQERALEDLLAEVAAGNADPADEETLKRFDNALLRLDGALHWYSRINEEDAKAANGDVVDPFLMDKFYRWHLEQPGKGLQAPNGELRTSFGSTGDPVPPSLMAVRGCDTDLFRRVILDKLTVPFNHRICIPIQTRYNKILGRGAPLPSQGLSARTLDILVRSLECLIAVGCMTTAVLLLYTLESTKNRLIVAPFASLACTVPVIFFSKEAKGIFTLTAGTWAVLIVIVFLTTANFNCRSG